jgi:hypothetical protein
MTDVIETEVPTESKLRASLADADFYDAWAAPLRDAALSPTEFFCARPAARRDGCLDC